MPKSNPHLQLVRFVLEKSAEESVATRITLYTALKDLCGSEPEAGKLQAMICLLESEEKIFNELKGTR